MEDALAPGLLMGMASLELHRHGREVEARPFCEQAITWMGQVKPEDRWSIGVRNTLWIAHWCLGKLDEVRRLYAEEAVRQGTSLGSRGLAMRNAVVMGDTAGALALADTMRTAELEAFRDQNWGVKGAAMYYAAQILALLGRKDEAVALFREALNRGWRVGPDEALWWYWAPVRDYPPFVALVRNRDGS